MAQNGESLAKLAADDESNRDQIERVPLNAGEVYLLAKVREKLGFKTKAMTFRWLLSHFEDIERAERAIRAIKARQSAEAEEDAAFKSMEEKGNV